MQKISVLHIVSNLNCGGLENMIMNIYRNIDREKINFDFLCLSSIEGVFEEEIKKKGGKIYKVPQSTNKIIFLNSFLRKNKYKAIHSHVMFYSGIVNLLAKINGIKIRITHSHSSSDLKKESIFRKIYMSISRFLINTFSNVKLSCGEKAGKYLYGNKSKFTILNNGIHLEKFLNVTEEEVIELKNELNIKKDDLIIGHVGSFLEVKNQEFFIQLAKKMVNKKENFKIVLVGTGKLFEHIKQLIQEEELQEYFVLTGIRKDIPVFMKMFDVFMMPSLYEGFPLAVVEALAGDNICYLSNNISKETQVIKDRVKFFDLNDDLNELITNIKNDINNKQNIDIEDILNEKGYSIKEMTNKITNIYCS